MLKTYQYRLYPSLYQKQILSIQFSHNRFIWNNTLNYLKGEYQKYLYEKVNNPEIKQKFINLSDIIKRLPILKQEIEWLSLAHSQTLQATMKRLDQSFQMFFKKKKTLDEGFATLSEIESGGINQLASDVSILSMARNDKTQVAS